MEERRVKRERGYMEVQAEGGGRYNEVLWVSGGGRLPTQPGRWRHAGIFTFKSEKTLNLEMFCNKVSESFCLTYREDICAVLKRCHEQHQDSSNRPSEGEWNVRFLKTGPAHPPKTSACAGPEQELKNNQTESSARCTEV